MSSRTHDTFHVEKLRLYVPPSTYFEGRDDNSRPSPERTDFGDEFKILTVIQGRIVGRSKPRAEFEVQWVLDSIQPS